MNSPFNLGRAFRAITLGVLATIPFYPRSAWAQAGTTATVESVCASLYRFKTKLDLAAAMSGADSRVSHRWGEANATVTGSSSSGGPVLRVTYPIGSINPGNAMAPVGGAGFQLQLPDHADAGCLSYRVRFAPGFDFAKGGKLPGLYGGVDQRGCVAPGPASGFSARLMWRAGGMGELYLYAPGRTTRCGESIARGAWRFTPGTWIGVTEEVIANAPGRSDGVIRVWIDGKRVVEQIGLVLRDSSGIGVDGLLFSTFFGGSDPGWASPRDQYAEFGDFTLWTGRTLP
ncbi:polysaccharide lyase [Rhodovastum atsumiense]|uniref:Polysaccharide lyase 14 domain-containing protein n=1 Tax=Rhodovastum atsumiense TaxID=504468 RepID=A0A5M6IXR7_9PROT|nr:hypothetical protein [Rhodovastum atsumiense]KAA5612145.1 hypothetical protein F1189_10785 [Rhodovastum atsumiense]